MTANRAVLGVDFGTTFAKAVLATERGEIVARASVAQRVDRSPGGAVEQDPDGWWTSLRGLVRETLGQAPGGRGLALAGVAISGHLPTLVMADEDGRPLAPAMLYADRRADAFIDQACDLAGQRLSGDELLPKLLWLAARDPARLRPKIRIFNLQDFLVHRLTGARALDHRTAMRSGLYDPVAMEWRRDVVGRLGLNPSALPEVRGAGEVAGVVRAEAEAGLGIPAGTPVLVGLGDTPATLIGAGVVRSGDVLVYYGTTTTLDVCTHDVPAYLADPSLIREWAFYREVGYAVLGPAIRWAANRFEPLEAEGAEHAAGADLAALDDAAAALAPERDAPFVIPSFEAHVAAGASSPSALIAFQPTHGRPELHRALLESFGFVARAGLEESGLGGAARRFVAAGGGAASALWRQIVSDTLGVEQSWAPRSDAALGDAMLAAWALAGSDVFGADLPDWLGEMRTTTPDAARREVQRHRFAVWLATRRAITEAARRSEAQTR